MMLRTSTVKTFRKNVFLLHRYIYMVTCRLQCAQNQYNKTEKRKQYKREKNVLSLRKYFQLQDIIHMCECSTFNCLVQQFYMETKFSFSIKIILAKKRSCFEFCYFIYSIFCYSVLVVFLGVVLLLNRCSPVRLFRGIPTVRPVFRCSASVPVFHQCSAVPPVLCVPQFLALVVFRQCSIVQPVFRCCTDVPQFRVPKFLVLKYVM